MRRVGLIVLLVVASPRPAAACQVVCTAKNHHQRLQQSDVAFRGRAIEVEPVGDAGWRARMRVDKIYEGIEGPPDRWIHFHDHQQSFCFGTGFQIGETYEVFATFDDGELHVAGPCDTIHVREHEKKLPDSDRPAGGCAHCGAGPTALGETVTLVVIALLLARRRSIS